MDKNNPLHRMIRHESYKAPDMHWLRIKWGLDDYDDNCSVVDLEKAEYVDPEIQERIDGKANKAFLGGFASFPRDSTSERVHLEERNGIRKELAYDPVRAHGTVNEEAEANKIIKRKEKLEKKKFQAGLDKMYKAAVQKRREDFNARKRERNERIARMATKPIKENFHWHPEWKTKPITQQKILKKDWSYIKQNRVEELREKRNERSPRSLKQKLRRLEELLEEEKRRKQKRQTYDFTDYDNGHIDWIQGQEQHINARTRFNKKAEATEGNFSYKRTIKKPSALVRAPEVTNSKRKGKKRASKQQKKSNK